MATQLTPILTRFWDDPQSWTLETYERNEGYQALRAALSRPPEELVSMFSCRDRNSIPRSCKAAS